MSRRAKRPRNQKDGWEEWGGYMGAKIHKLQQQVQKDSSDCTESGKTGLFSGIAIHVNGYTKPSWAELKRLMIAHGGVYHHYYSSSLVTHIIASNLPDSKLKQLTDQKVVHPKWITDSIDAGRLLPYQDYLIGHRKGQQHTAIKKALSFGKTPEDTLDQARAESLVCEADEKIVISEETEKPGVTDRSNDTHVEKSLAQSATVQNEGERLSIGPSVKAKHLDKASTSRRAGDPNFVSDFYNNSRLHHLSTWGAEWKAYVNELQKQASSFPAREALRQHAAAEGGWRTEERKLGKSERVIMHIDMDSFFVSVGLRKRPDLKGKPIAVTHSKGTNAKERPGTDINFEISSWRSKTNKLSKSRRRESGAALDEIGEEDEGYVEHATFEPSSANLPNSMAEIASCSYEARQAGVKNGMFFGRAKQLCPDLIPIPYDFEGYREVSQILYDTIAQYTHDIEAVSCDELLVDCSDLLTDVGLSPDALAAAVREEITHKTSCNVSAGLGPSILIARMATRVAKPNGQLWVDNADKASFMIDKPVRNLPGVGWSISKKLEALGVTTCGDLQKQSMSTLQTEFGPKTGLSLYNFSRGIDDRPIKMERERKSVSAEINYGIRFTKESEAEAFMNTLSEEVHSRLTKLNMKCKTITIKLKVRKAGAPQETAKFMGHGICDNVAKTITLPLATNCANVIKKESCKVIQLLQIDVSEFRGVGIQLGKLEPVDIGASSGKAAASTPSILNFTTTVKTPPNKNSAASPVVLSSSDKRTESEVTRQLYPAEENERDVQASKTVGSPVSSSLPPLPTLATFVSPCSSQAAASPPVQAADECQLSTSRSVNSPHRPHDPVVLPGASQLDLSCINELPEELQEELECIYGTPLRKKRQEYKARKESEEARSPEKAAIHPLMLMQAKASPTSSPSKKQQRKNSPRKSLSPKKSRSPNKPAFKVPVGRPPGRQKKKQLPRKLNLSPEKTPACQNRDITQVGDDAEAEQERNSTDQRQTAGDINLGGAITLPDVKTALLEWIQSSERPDLEDEEMVVNYLTLLVQHRDLERVFLLLRFLRRRINRLAPQEKHSSWLQCYFSMQDQTQAIVQSLYGGLLKL